MDDAHITTINRLAARLERRQSAEELLTVRQRRQQLNHRWVPPPAPSPRPPAPAPHLSAASCLTIKALYRWSKFHGDLNNYKKKLEEALVVHDLIRELEDVRDRANEKVSHMTLQVGSPSEDDRIMSPVSVLSVDAAAAGPGLWL